MKKIMHKTAAAALLCLLASCDSFLSKEPFAELGADTYFTNENRCSCMPTVSCRR